MSIDLMNLPWFFAAALAGIGETLALDEEESRHARSSRRLVTGDEVGVFDGLGGVIRGAVESPGKRGPVQVKALERHEAPPPALRATLASALPKGDRAAVMLGMAAQLGAAAFVPLRCERSIVTAGRGFAAKAARTMIESCKQCHRAWLPVVQDETALSDLVAATHGDELWMAHPGTAAERLAKAWPVGFAPKNGVTILIGPEGGFTDEEEALVKQRGGNLIGLGEGLLRVETAAVAVLSWVMMASMGKE